MSVISASVVRRSGAWLALLLPCALVTMLLGVIGGLARFGILAESAPQPTVTWHGPLILFGFLGVLVSIERAVALRAAWSFAASILGVAGAVEIMLGVPLRVVAATWACAALVAGLAIIGIERRFATLATRTMLASCIVWFVGVVLWGIGRPLGELIGWWAAFLILMIVGERTQFGRLHFYPRTRRIVIALASFVLGGAVLTLIAPPQHGLRLCGVGMVMLGAWMLLVDVRRRARRPGLLRFVSVGLVFANAWLIVSGLLWVAYPPVTYDGPHDAAVHALFLGFVMGMVFAHAPMIFPALTGVRMPFHRGFYVHLALLHVALAVRVGADVLGSGELVRRGSEATAAALILFVLVTGAAAVRGATAPPEVARSSRQGQSPARSSPG